MSDFGSVQTAPLTRQFIDLAPIGGVTYEWDFGDGTPVSNAPSPVHLFQAAGAYTVVMRRFNGPTLLDTRSHLVGVSSFDFGSTLMTLLTRQFVDLMPPDPSLQPRYQIVFGDGTFNVNTPMPIVHTFPSAGAYSMSVSRSLNNGTQSERCVHSVGV